MGVFIGFSFLGILDDMIKFVTEAWNKYKSRGAREKDEEELELRKDECNATTPFID